MDELRITLRSAPTDCWSCGAETIIISSIHLRAANDEAECSVSDFTGHPALIQDLSPAIAGLGNMGEIKPRFSKTLAKPYMSNGCAHCDALFGQHFELMTRYDEHDPLTWKFRHRDNGRTSCASCSLQRMGICSISRTHTG